MAELFYTTIENQKRQDGSFGLLYDHFEGEVDGISARKRALSKFYYICAAAAIAPIYTEVILKCSDGTTQADMVFDNQPEPEPEPDPDPETETETEEETSNE